MVFLPTTASKNLIFKCEHGALGFQGCTITDTPVALNFFNPFMPVFSKALDGSFPPVILEKLTAAFSKYLLPDISQLRPPPP